MSHDVLFTSESVTRGHPDKLCDQISDALVDGYLHKDPQALINAECAVSRGVLFLAVQFASEHSVDAPGLARQVITDAGYQDSAFNARDATIMTTARELPLAQRHPDPHSLDPDQAYARQQATLFGYACDHNPAYLPQSLWLAHLLAAQLDQVRENGEFPELAPDGMAQVGFSFKDRRPHQLYNLNLIAAQRSDRELSIEALREGLLSLVIAPVCQDRGLDLPPRDRLVINPEGPVADGGPMLHAGLTGRKNAIDTYGQYARHSGAALSGKDPWRIDRIGAYAARHCAKQVVAAGLARECEVQLSFAIGHSQPVSVEIQTFGSGQLDDDRLRERVLATFDFRLASIVRRFGAHLLPQQQPHFYQRIARYGHMGREDLDPPWERLDSVAALQQ